MGLDDGGGGRSVGIDPEALDTLITDAETAAGDVESFVSTYRGRFRTYGVSTINLTHLERVAEWVRDQIPMLTRRRNLAQIAADQNGLSFVTNGAGELPWDTADEAAEAGREDAKRLLGDVEMGDEIPPEVYDLLLENNMDPDYVEAFFNEAGPGVLENFLYDAGHDYDGDEPFDPAKMVPLSYALATASHRIDFTDEQWLREASGNSPNQWAFMAQFMGYGTWSEGFLHEMADHLTYLDFPEDQATVLNALSRNPVAAATWYQGEPPEERGWDTNAELIGWIMQGEVPMIDNDEIDAAVINMLEAATDGVAKFDQELADKSVLTLLENVDSWGDGASAEGPYQKWFGDVVERHIDDVYDSVTSPTPSYFSELRDGRDGVEAPAAMWASLTEQAMRDEETAAYLSLLFEDKYDTVRERWEGTAPDESEYANNLKLAQTRQFSGWFIERTENTREALDLEVEEWNSRMEGAVDLLFSATDPKGMVKDLAIDTAKNIVTSIFEKDKPDYDVDTEWATSLEQNLHSSASNSYEKKRNDDGTLPEVTLNYGDYEITYNGDPADYEESYGGRFTDDDGNLLEIEEMDERGLQAYTAWVQDPAVQQAYWDDFRADMPAGLE